MIIRNAARCRKCNDEIESKHVHDFVECKCGAIFVDGGKDYLRSGGNPEDFIPLYILKKDKTKVKTKLLNKQKSKKVFLPYNDNLDDYPIINHPKNDW